MKAKAALSTMLILMIGFAGFGKTTSDPVQNSNPEVVQMDNSESVVMEIELVQYQNDYEAAAIKAARETDLELAKSYNALLAEMNAAFLELYNIELKELEAPPNIEEPSEINQCTCQCSFKRNPRDGISYR